MTSSLLLSVTSMETHKVPLWNQARATKWKSLKKKSLMRLLPDDGSLEQHIKRANFLAYIQHHPDLRRHPSPIGHGWELVNGYCRPVRHTKPALPSLLLVSPAQQDQYNSDPEANSEAEDEAAFNSDFDSESSTVVSWSHLMNIKYLCIVLYTEPAYCLLIIY